MIKSYFYTLLTASIFICGCEQAEITDESSSSILTVKVLAEPFTSIERNSTRASEELYKTKFADGDQIGVTAIKDGKIVDGVDNVCFIYKEVTKKWEVADGSSSLYYYKEGVSYIAYYPHSATMNGITTETGIIDNFTPKTNQSLYADYTASDLMTGTGTLTQTGNAYTVTFQLAHRMTLLVLTPDPYANCMAPADAGYEYYPGTRIKGTITNVKINNASAYAVEDNTYRLIVKPGTMDVPLEYTLSSSPTNFTFTALTLTAGTYRQFNLGHPALTIEREVQIGDYYYSHGKLAPGADGEEPVDKDNCIGVVFHIGPGNGDDVSKYSGTGLKDKIQGYVIAKKLYANNSTWSATNEDIETIKDKEQFVGYSNTVIMLNANCNAAKAVPKDGVPSATSGWYLGSLGQYNYLKNNIGKVFSSMQRAGLDKDLVSTWTSTEYEYNIETAYNVSIRKTGVTDYKGSKQSAEGILPILTF